MLAGSFNFFHTCGRGPQHILYAALQQRRINLAKVTDLLQPLRRRHLAQVFSKPCVAQNDRQWRPKLVAHDAHEVHLCPVGDFGCLSCLL